MIVLPELCLTSYSCSDLFLQEKLLSGAMEGLKKIASFTSFIDALIFVGMPFEYRGKLYNVAAVLNYGKVLGFVPKSYIPNYNEFYEARHFAAAMQDVVEVEFDGNAVPMGTRLLFSCDSMPGLCIAAEICEDLWGPEPPSIRHARNGATVIVNLSASNETTGKEFLSQGSGKRDSLQDCCVAMSMPVPGMANQRRIWYIPDTISLPENGHILSESPRFTNDTIFTEIDVNRLLHERRRMTTFVIRDDGYVQVDFSLNMEETTLTRFVDPMPFVPEAQMTVKNAAMRFLRYRRWD